MRKCTAHFKPRIEQAMLFRRQARNRAWSLGRAIKADLEPGLAQRRAPTTFTLAAISAGLVTSVVILMKRRPRQ